LATAGTLLREYAEVVFVAALLALFAKTFVFEGFEIPTPSMEDNLLVGDHIIVNKFVYAPHRGPWARFLPHKDPQPGDVFVFKSPETPERDFVKRVIGAPSDEVEIDEKELYRNGWSVEERYVTFKDPAVYPPEGPEPEALRRRDNTASFTVPAGRYFALGDNRDDSRDSRFWGLVPGELVKGQALLIYWSYDVRAARSFPGPAAPLRRFLDTAIHFFGRTRWERSFQQIP